MNTIKIIAALIALQSAIYPQQLVSNQLRLLAAAANGQTDQAVALIRAGEGVNFTVPEFPGMTPLHFAVGNRNVALIYVLLEHGADCTAPGPIPGMSPIGIIRRRMQRVSAAGNIDEIMRDMTINQMLENGCKKK